MYKNSARSLGPSSSPNTLAAPKYQNSSAISDNLIANISGWNEILSKGKTALLIVTLPHTHTWATLVNFGLQTAKKNRV